MLKQFLSYIGSVDIQFIDNNTIKLTRMSEEIDTFDIVSNTRCLYIEVK